MGEAAEDWVAELAVDVEHRRNRLSPADVFVLRSLVRHVVIERPVFGALQFGWSADRTGLTLHVSAQVRAVGPETPNAMVSIACAHKLDHETFLLLAKEGKRDACIQRLVKIARQALLNFAQHEVDEQLLVDGQRVFDPHGPNAFPEPPVETEVSLLASLARAHNAHGEGA